MAWCLVKHSFTITFTLQELKALAFGVVQFKIPKD
jgi:hypothetical protein